MKKDIIELINDLQNQNKERVILMKLPNITDNTHIGILYKFNITTDLIKKLENILKKY
jgi:hypothetical protein